MSMRTEHGMTASTTKQRLNLTVRADLVQYARKAKPNPSQVLEETLLQRQREEAARRWQEENREAIEYHRRRIERDGMLNKDLLAF
ncbi:type II toxin-antitoxin system CcdA family antitoxin [Sinimarinibacterium thermocellulolyticum]|uniref:Type II toxin-antitoxin system CcdA family antitoxin n=1 Tax=Sinimarinibacterium thermocellulolyticum TaxID=3170016 RepID=A0ABV2AC72_9GAMM